jgi:hypothetical protein
MSKASSLLSIVATAAFLLSAATIQAQIEVPEAVYPSLPKRGTSLQDFVPSGWTVERELRGDLNGDKAPDLLFLLRQTDPRNLVPNPDGFGVGTLNSNPRILAAAFASDGGYTLMLEDHELIPRHELPTLDDPFGDLTIGRGTFALSLNYFSSAGSWGMSTWKYTFRFRSSCFQLIGYDLTETMRNTGKMTTTSINYSTGKVQVVTGTIDSDRTKTKWKKLSKRRPLCLERIGNGWEFDPR